MRRSNRLPCSRAFLKARMAKKEPAGPPPMTTMVAPSGSATRPLMCQGSHRHHSGQSSAQILLQMSYTPPTTPKTRLSPRCFLVILLDLPPSQTQCGPDEIRTEKGVHAFQHSRP